MVDRISGNVGNGLNNQPNYGLAEMTEAAKGDLFP